MSLLSPNTLALLKEQLPIDEIFQWTYQRDGKKYTMLHIHVQPHPGMRFGEARETCENILDGEKNLHFTFYFTKEIQKEIDLGCARFHIICQETNRIYLNPNAKSTIQIAETTVADLSLKAIAYINKEVEKIQSFINGYNFYLTNHNYAHAAFMLHQALELCCRTAQKLLSGDEKKSHSLKNNIAFLKIFDSALGKLGKKSEEEAALVKLDESYIAFRYEQNFHMEKEPLECCYKITCRAMEWLTQYATIFLQEIEEKFNPQHIARQKFDILLNETNMKQETEINQNHRDLILNALQSYGQLQVLYCFAYRNRRQQMTNLLNIHRIQQDIHHYYLFAVMSNKQQSVMELQNNVQQLLPDNIHVTLLVDHSEITEKRIKKGDIFRINLLRSAECWHEDIPFDLEGIDIAPAHLSQAKWQWHKRFSNAKSLMQPYVEGTGSLTEEASCYVFGVALEQACFGLIQYFLHYMPDTSNLNYLMDLCAIICPEATAVFLREDQEQQQMFNLLIDAQRKFRYSANYGTKGDQLFTLYTRIEDFIQKADEIVNEDYKTCQETSEHPYAETA